VKGGGQIIDDLMPAFIFRSKPKKRCEGTTELDREKERREIQENQGGGGGRKSKREKGEKKKALCSQREGRIN